MEEGQVLSVTDEKGKEICAEKEKVVESKPEQPKIIIDLLETGAVNVSFAGKLGRIMAFGMLEDAKIAITRHYEQEAMRKEMLRQKIAKPGLSGFKGLFRR